MQIVHFSEKDIGSFDWELPACEAACISKLPLEAQGVIIGELKKQLHAFTLTLIGSLKMGPRIGDALDAINESQKKLSRELIGMAQAEINKS